MDPRAKFSFFSSLESSKPWLVSFACFHQEDNMTFPYLIFEEFAEGKKYALELTDQKEQKT